MPTPEPLDPYSRHVLAIDDDRNVLRILERSLQFRGFQVRTASSGAAGLSAMAEKPAQVVLCDHRMPEQTGLEVLQAIKERFPDAQRILSTGLVGPDALEQSLADGVLHAMLPKPWEEAHLTLAVARAFERYDLIREKRRLEVLVSRGAEGPGALDWGAVSDAVEFPILVLGSRHEVLASNPAFCRLVGRQLPELKGRPGREAFSAFRSAARLFDRLPAGPDAVTVEIEEEGRSLCLGARAAGELTVCWVQECTDVRRAAARTLVAEKLASVAQLAGGLAHELNNPLGGILAFTQLMQRDAGRSASDLESLADIESAALRAKRIVEDLLKFGRRISARMEVFDFNQAAEAAASAFRAEMLGKRQDVLLSVQLAQEPLPVLGDLAKLVQALIHLLANALTALEGRTGTIALSTSAEDGSAVATVSDDGVGIPPAILAHVFEPTFTTRPTGKGNGFGLPIAWRVVESHGGAIDVESQVGKGSTFTMSLPLSKGR